MATTPRDRGTRAWLAALALVLAFPIVGMVIGIGVQTKYDGDLVTAVEQQVGRSLTPDERSAVTIDVYCSDPAASGDSVCSDVSIAAALRAVSLGTGVVGLLLLAVIAALSLRARRDREALVRLFVPGLYVTLAGVAILVVADGLIAIASLYLGIGVFLNRVYPVLMLAIGLGVLVAVVGVLRAMLTARRRAITHVVGRTVDAAAEPRLHESIHGIVHELGIEGPEHLVVGLDPGFFVTEADVVATDGVRRGRTLYLSLPMSRLMTPGELRAVVGHEMGHFLGSDTQYSRRFYPVYRGATGAIAALATAGGNSGARAIALIPALLLLDLFLDGFAVAERGISRERELAADRVGSELSSPRDIATALVKVTAFGPLFDEAVSGFAAGSTRVPSPAGTAIPDTIGDRFVDLARAASTPAVLEGLGDRSVEHPTDSHPPLATRLAALGLTLADVGPAALDLRPDPAADAIVTGRDGYEEELTAWVASRIATSSAPRVPAAQPS
jgi:Zn-dependent protease with chaperone function